MKRLVPGSRPLDPTASSASTRPLSSLASHTMSDDDEGPDARVSLEVGITGLLLFSILLVMAAVSLRFAKNKYSWRMFMCSTVMSVLEIPRYIALIVQEAYTNRGTYMLHMWASVAFFAAFTCVIYIMHDAVDLSQSHSPLTAMITSPKSFVDRLIIDKTALIVINLLFAILTFATCISCMLYMDLENFFHESISYKLFTLADVIKNLVVAAAFMFYGWRLKKRINAFYDSFGITASSSPSPAEMELLLKLKTVVRRLLIVMVMCLASFTLRTIMLIIKGVCVEENRIHLKWLPTFGMLWWVLSDFIPRGLPILSFIVFFGGRARIRSRENSNNKLGSVRSMSDADNALRRFEEDGLSPGGDNDHRQALLSELHGEDGPDAESDTDFSSRDNSGHHYNKLPGLRESTSSMDSYETTSSSHTVYRNTATTSEFSTSYRPHNGRKSESVGGFTGSVIVNALMWPIGSSNNPYRNNNHGSSGKLSDSTLSPKGGNTPNTPASTASGVPPTIQE